MGGVASKLVYSTGPHIDRLGTVEEEREYGSGAGRGGGAARWNSGERGLKVAGAGAGRGGAWRRGPRALRRLARHCMPEISCLPAVSLKQIETK